LARQDRKTPALPVYNEVVPQPKEDEIESAIKQVRQLVGANLGEGESRVLVDLILDVISNC
jgi:hypothetical protein